MLHRIDLYQPPLFPDDDKHLTYRQLNWQPYWPLIDCIEDEEGVYIIGEHVPSTRHLLVAYVGQGHIKFRVETHLREGSEVSKAVGSHYNLSATWALLNDLVKDLGLGKAAEQFGVDRKTLWRWQRAAELPPRLAETLERMLLQRALAAMEEDRETVRALEERVSEMEGQLAAALAAYGGGSGNGSGGDSDVDGAAIDALRREFAQELHRLERRLEDRGAVAPDAGSGGARTVRAGAARRYPDLVTREPADDDEEVYGAAWPLIDEWRTLWVGHSPLGKGLAWASRRERILELEVAMLEEHGLTLPPETTPLRGLDRNEQLNWRVRELAKVRRQRARLVRLRWARRVLTLGLWRR